MSENRLPLLAWSLILVFLGFIGFGIATMFDAYSILDDACFYARYAHNLLVEGVVTWNPGGSAEFGPTSLFYVAVLLPFVAMFPNTPALAILCGSVTGAVALLALLFALIWRTTPRHQRPFAGVLVAFSLAVSAREFSSIATNGMDTTLAMATLAAMLWRFCAHERRPSRSSAVFTGLLAALAFGVRADLLLFAFGVPAVAAVLHRDSARRGEYRLMFGVSAAALGLQTLLAAQYFGLPLPVSFYAKGLAFFDREMHEMFAETPRRELLAYTFSYRFLFAVIAFDVVSAPRRWWREASALEKGIAAAALAFVIYYLCFVLQMVGKNRRFYYPTLPAFAWLASRSLGRIIEPRADPDHGARLSVPIRAATIGSLLLVCAASPSLWEIRTYESHRRAAAERHGRFNVGAMVREIVNPSVWFGLADLAALPASLTIASTEVGFPGILCRHQSVADLSGLNESWMIRTGGFEAEEFFKRCQPDLIYMVYPTYPRVDRELRNHRVFRDEYELHPDIGLGIAVRKSSPHYDAIRAILERRAR